MKEDSTTFEHFRSQARVIDLLGREQIADSPTAIGEIFKNALDAAARGVTVDYRGQSDMLVIRDDGLGMRHNDVVEKWLVLATDSSHRSEESNAAWAKYADQEQRLWLKEPRYGEKGIGRLSVSLLGRYTLLWTVWGKDEDKTGTLCLVHWHLFRHPRKLFEDLPIPCIKLSRPATSEDVNELLENLRDSPEIKMLLNDTSWAKDFRSDLTKDLDQDFDLDGALPWENGTSFYIRGLNDFVPELFEKRNAKRKPDEELSTDALKSFHAFATFWDPFHEHSNGRDFKIEATVDGQPIPETNRYWEPSDFTRCDHHIRIDVNDNGYATGILRNYGQKPTEYRKQLIALPAGHRSPGRFLVEIGYLQGTPTVSKLPKDDYAEIQERLEHAGGFSIYLNGVRVQPYGTSDNDFAGFESRRLKNAGRYYFASRRMFGGVFIPSAKETELREKAGREGFVANGARKGLRLWIEDLFVDLADSFYGSSADRPDKKEAKRKREQADKTRKRLKEEKTRFLKDVRNASNQQDEVIRQITELVKLVAAHKNSEDNALPGTHIGEIQRNLDVLRGIARGLYNTPDLPPVGVVLEGDEIEGLETYRSKRARMILDLNKILQKLSQELEDARSRHLDYQERVVLVQQRIDGERVSLLAEVNDLIAPIINRHADIQSRIQQIGKTEETDLRGVFEEALSGISAESVVSDRTNREAQRLEEGIQKTREYFEETVKPRLVELGSEIDHLLDNTSSAVLAQSLADEVTRLKDRETYLVDLAQLGLVTETATHEHENHVKKVQEAIVELRKKLSGKDLETLTRLATSFEIVDTRLRLFDPLIRRQGATSQNLDGRAIEDFLRNHFGEYFENGTIEVTTAFRDYNTSYVKIPVFLGAVYNLVHNAVYWCRQGTTGQPRIRLSCGSGLLVVSDSGPGVSPRDAIRIFEPGFSRKPYGRGLGLFIAREALEGIGYTLFLASEVQPGGLAGANFGITKRGDAEDE